MQIPITIDQAIILAVLGFAFRTYQRFDKSIDKMEETRQSLNSLVAEIKQLWTAGNDLSIKVQKIDRDVQELKKDFDEFKNK